MFAIHLDAGSAQRTEIILDKIHRLIGPIRHDGRRPTGRTHPSLHNDHSNCDFKARDRHFVPAVGTRTPPFDCLGRSAVSEAGGARIFGGLDESHLFCSGRQPRDLVLRTCAEFRWVFCRIIAPGQAGRPDRRFRTAAPLTVRGAHRALIQRMPSARARPAIT